MASLIRENQVSFADKENASAVLLLTDLLALRRDRLMQLAAGNQLASDLEIVRSELVAKDLLITQLQNALNWALDKGGWSLEYYSVVDEPGTYVPETLERLLKVRDC